MWKTNMRNPSSPWCWNFGGTGCHNSTPKKCLNSTHFFGFSKCAGTPCNHVENSDVKLARVCRQLPGAAGGSRHDTQACRDKCEANPECRMWKTNMRNPSSPWCWNFGGTGCHNSTPKKSLNSTHFFGFSKCAAQVEGHWDDEN